MGDSRIDITPIYSHREWIENTMREKNNGKTQPLNSRASLSSLKQPKDSSKSHSSYSSVSSYSEDEGTLVIRATNRPSYFESLSPDDSNTAGYYIDDYSSTDFSHPLGPPYTPIQPHILEPIKAEEIAPGAIYIHQSEYQPTAPVKPDITKSPRFKTP